MTKLTKHENRVLTSLQSGGRLQINTNSLEAWIHDPTKVNAHRPTSYRIFQKLRQTGLIRLETSYPESNTEFYTAMRFGDTTLCNVLVRLPNGNEAKYLGEHNGEHVFQEDNGVQIVIPLDKAETLIVTEIL